MSAFLRLFASCLLLGALAGCTTWDNISSPRTAMEQLLLSTSADRALRVEGLGIESRRVWLDTTNLQSYDRGYVIGRIREALSARAYLVDDPLDAEIVVEAYCGGLAVDKSDFLLGIPSIPIPLGSAGAASTAAAGEGMFRTPELSLFKITKHCARAKFSLFSLDSLSRRPLGRTGLLYAEASYNRYIFFYIPFSSSDFLPGLQQLALERNKTLSSKMPPFQSK